MATPGIPDPATLNKATAVLEAKYGPGYREALGLVDYPHADTDDAAFWDIFGDIQFDPAPDLSCQRSTFGMARP